MPRPARSTPLDLTSAAASSASPTGSAAPAVSAAPSTLAAPATIAAPSPAPAPTPNEARAAAPGAEHPLCILAGHGRVEAARLLGWDSVPCVRLEHMTPAQKRAYVLADNKLALNAGWDEECLGEELAALMAEAELGFDLEVTGFSIAEVDLLVDGLAVEEAGDPREDALPAAAEAPRRVQPGDVWQLGPHRLVCGDALDPAVVERLMMRSAESGTGAGDGTSKEDCQGGEPREGGESGPRERARMVFSDPPYNVPIDGHVITRKPDKAAKSAKAAQAAKAAAGREDARGSVRPSGIGEDGGTEVGPLGQSGAGVEVLPLRAAPRHREFAMASGEMSREEFTAFLATAFQNMADHSLDGSVHFLCMDWRHLGEMLEAGQAVYSELKNLIVWAKDNGGMGSFYRSRHELVFAFKKGSAPHLNSFELGQHGRYRTKVWEYRGVNTRRAGRLEELALHPTCKPVGMVADAIKDVSGRGDIVLDLFGGSGSTLIAAHKTGRRARLVEIDPVYCDRILARWEQYAHDEAVRVERGGESGGEEARSNGGGSDKQGHGGGGRKTARGREPSGAAGRSAEGASGGQGRGLAPPGPTNEPARPVRAKRTPLAPAPANGTAEVSTAPAAAHRGPRAPRSPSKGAGIEPSSPSSLGDRTHEEVRS